MLAASEAPAAVVGGPRRGLRRQPPSAPEVAAADVAVGGSPDNLRCSVRLPRRRLAKTARGAAIFASSRAAVLPRPDAR